MKWMVRDRFRNSYKHNSDTRYHRVPAVVPSTLRHEGKKGYIVAEICYDSGIHSLYNCRSTYSHFVEKCLQVDDKDKQLLPFFYPETSSTTPYPLPGTLYPRWPDQEMLKGNRAGTCLCFHDQDRCNPRRFLDEPSHFCMFLSFSCRLCSFSL